MRDINYYLDLARERQGCKSDRKLALLLGTGPTTTNTWRTGRSLPDDESMVRLAAMAGADRQLALIDLNIWRTEGSARADYIELARRLGRTAAALFCVGLLGAIGVLGLAPDARAARGLGQLNQALAISAEARALAASIDYAIRRTVKRLRRNAFRPFLVTNPNRSLIRA